MSSTPTTTSPSNFVEFDINNPFSAYSSDDELLNALFQLNRKLDDENSYASFMKENSSFSDKDASFVSSVFSGEKLLPKPTLPKFDPSLISVVAPFSTFVAPSPSTKNAIPIPPLPLLSEVPEVTIVTTKEEVTIETVLSSPPPVIKLIDQRALESDYQCVKDDTQPPSLKSPVSVVLAVDEGKPPLVPDAVAKFPPVTPLSSKAPSRFSLLGNSAVDDMEMDSSSSSSYESEEEEEEEDRTESSSSSESEHEAQDENQKTSSFGVHCDDMEISSCASEEEEEENQPSSAPQEPLYYCKNKLVYDVSGNVFLGQLDLWEHYYDLFPVGNGISRQVGEAISLSLFGGNCSIQCEVTSVGDDICRVVNPSIATPSQKDFLDVSSSQLKIAYQAPQSTEEVRDYLSHSYKVGVVFDEFITPLSDQEANQNFLQRPYFYCNNVVFRDAKVLSVTQSVLNKMKSIPSDATVYENNARLVSCAGLDCVLVRVDLDISEVLALPNNSDKALNWMKRKLLSRKNLTPNLVKSQVVNEEDRQQLQLTFFVDDLSSLVIPLPCDSVLGVSYAELHKKADELMASDDDWVVVGKPSVIHQVVEVEKTGGKRHKSQKTKVDVNVPVKKRKRAAVVVEEEQEENATTDVDVSFFNKKKRKCLLSEEELDARADTLIKLVHNIKKRSCKWGNKILVHFWREIIPLFVECVPVLQVIARKKGGRKFINRLKTILDDPVPHHVAIYCEEYANLFHALLIHSNDVVKGVDFNIWSSALNGLKKAANNDVKSLANNLKKRLLKMCVEKRLFSSNVKANDNLTWFQYIQIINDL